jgi:hypothetical protein
MKSIADNNEGTLNRYLPLNFTSLLNQFSDNMKSKQLLSSISSMKKNLTIENTGSLVTKYKELIDLSKIKEMNLEKDSFFNNYKKKLSAYKDKAYMPISKVFRQASCFHLKEEKKEKKRNQIHSVELNYDKIKAKVEKETSMMMTQARKEVRKSFSQMKGATVPIKLKSAFSEECSPSMKACPKLPSKLDDYYLSQNLVLRPNFSGTKTVL